MRAVPRLIPTNMAASAVDNSNLGNHRINRTNSAGKMGACDIPRRIRRMHNGQAPRYANVGVKRVIMMENTLAIATK